MDEMETARRKLPNSLRPMRGAEADASSPSSAHEAARFIATVSLSLGALMLSLFGIIERMVTFEKLAVENEFALLALLPGIATLAFLACARAISWLITNMRFAHWHAVVPEGRWEETRRLVEETNQFRFRLTLMAGAYLLFTLVITALASTSAGLAFGLSALELGMSPLQLALVGGAVTAILVLYEIPRRGGEDRGDRGLRHVSYRRPCPGRGTLSRPVR
jgi:hypothetical protein